MSAIIKFFEAHLATLFDKLKMSSPVAYLIVMIIIFGGAFTVENATELGDKFPWLFNGIVDEIFKGLAAILLAPRTKRHMNNADDGTRGLSVVDIDEDD